MSAVQKIFCVPFFFLRCRLVNKKFVIGIAKVAGIYPLLKKLVKRTTNFLEDLVCKIGNERITMGCVKVKFVDELSSIEI